VFFSLVRLGSPRDGWRPMALVVAENPRDRFVFLVLLLVWLPLFWAGIKEFIYDSNKYLIGCHRIGYRIYFKFLGFSSHA
jgi:hypothetical protein